MPAIGPAARVACVCGSVWFFDVMLAPAVTESLVGTACAVRGVLMTRACHYAEVITFCGRLHPWVIHDMKKTRPLRQQESGSFGASGGVVSPAFTWEMHRAGAYASARTLRETVAREPHRQQRTPAHDTRGW